MLDETPFIVDHRVDSTSLGSLFLRGELDMHGTDRLNVAFDAVLDVLLNGAVCELHVSALSFCDSAGLACLLQIASKARRRGVRLELVDPPAHLVRLLAITGTESLFPRREESPDRRSLN